MKIRLIAGIGAKWDLLLLQLTFFVSSCQIFIADAADNKVFGVTRSKIRYPSRHVVQINGDYQNTGVNYNQGDYDYSNEGGYYSGEPANPFKGENYQNLFATGKNPSNKYISNEYVSNEHISKEKDQWPISPPSIGGISDPLPFPPTFPGDGGLTSFPLPGSPAGQSFGNTAVSLFRAKGQLIGNAVKTGAALGSSALGAATGALGTASSALATGTTLIKTTGDTASNVISAGSNIATGVIDTKGTFLSSAINTGLPITANLIDVKGRATTSILDTGEQALTQIATVINLVSGNKKPTTTVKPNLGWGGWSGWSEPSPVYSAPAGKVEKKPEKVKEVIIKPKPVVLQKKPQPQPQINTQIPKNPNNYKNNNYFQQYSQDYVDSYYNPRDVYSAPPQNSNRHPNANPPKKQVQTPPKTTYNLGTGYYGTGNVHQTRGQVIQNPHQQVSYQPQSQPYAQLRPQVLSQPQPQPYRSTTPYGNYYSKQQLQW